MVEHTLVWVLFACSLLCVISACHRSRNTDTANWLDGETAPDITGLSVTRGKAFHLIDERGKVVILSFGYTSYIELCPETFLKVRAVLGKLGAEADQVVFAYVTVDPERDQPKPFAAFLGSVDSRFQVVFLEGEPQTSLLSAYHVTDRKRLLDPLSYARRNIDPSAFYAIDHTAAIWLIDREGALRVRCRHDAPEREILTGVQLLLSEHG